MSKIQGCPRKDCLLIVKINMKRVVICGNMNIGEIEGLIQNVYLVFKYDAIVFFGEKQIGSIFFFLHLIACAATGRRISGAARRLPRPDSRKL